MSLRSMLGYALFLTVPSLALAACGTSLSSLCQQYCDCEGCSDRELDDCEENAADLEDKASRDGCTDELDAYADCLDENFKCSGDHARFTDSCGDEVEDLGRCSDGITIEGVGNSLCQAAADICGAGSGDEVAECSGAVVCVAQCIVDASSCDLTDPDLSNCVSSCSGVDQNPPPP